MAISLSLSLETCAGATMDGSGERAESVRELDAATGGGAIVRVCEGRGRGVAQAVSTASSTAGEG
jgi:hypothetical protein